MAEQNTSGDPEDDLYLTEAEQEQIFKLTDQFSHRQALRKVLKGERYRRYIAAEARQEMEQSSAEATQLNVAREEAHRQARTERTIQILRETDPDKLGR